MENDDFLREHPEIERSMWVDWVLTVCKNENIDLPNDKEWSFLSRKWYHGKKPIDSVDELRLFRSKT